MSNATLPTISAIFSDTCVLDNYTPNHLFYYCIFFFQLIYGQYYHKGVLTCYVLFFQVCRIITSPQNPNLTFEYACCPRHCSVLDFVLHSFACPFWASGSFFFFVVVIFTLPLSLTMKLWQIKQSSCPFRAPIMCQDAVNINGLIQPWPLLNDRDGKSKRESNKT